MLFRSANPGLCIERVIEFRDGTKLKFDLDPIELILNAEGEKDARNQTRVPINKASQITFSEIPALKRVERIKKALTGLRHESFAKREEAALVLTKSGSGFRGLLEEKLELSFDPEIKWRLRRVLEALPIYASDEFDHVRLDDRSFRGEFEDWQITAKYRGTDINLNRATVRSISAPPDSVNLKAILHAVEDPANSLVPLTCRKIDFERYPSGKALKAGDNIQQAFVDWGITLSTSVEDSYVSVNRYHIEGAGGGKSAATHDPLYEGEITISFCKPGAPRRPAGVYFIGCWIGIVKPGGTSMIAYGADGMEIGRVITTKEKSQFLGIKSNVPIARIGIVPNPDIDSNFALDDLVYDQPAPLFGALRPTHFSVSLNDGSRINCRSIEHRKKPGASDIEIVVKPGTDFAEEIHIPFNQVKVLVPPIGTNPPQDPFESKLWVRLSDGSRLALIRPAQGELKSMVGELTLEQLKISSLWASSRALQNPPGDLNIPKGGAAIIMRNDPLYLTTYKLGNEKFSGTRPDGSTVNYSYKRLPTIWIEKPTSQAPATGRIELTDGQTINFGQRCRFKSCAIDGNGIVVRTIPADEKITRPMGKPVHLDFRSIRSVHFH